MNDFIEEITDYSRNSRIQVNLEKISLKPLVKEIQESLRYIDSGNRIEFKIDIADDFIVRSDGGIG